MRVAARYVVTLLDLTYSKKLITSKIRRIEIKEISLPKRQYIKEFKAEAVGFAASVGGNEAAQRLGIPVAVLGNRSRRAIALSSAGGVPCKRTGRPCAPTGQRVGG